jgi:hypothetical protein
MGFPMLMEEYGGEAPHTVSTLYAKVFPDPRGRPSLTNHTQQQNHTAFKYPASRSPLRYGCIKFAMGSSALELRGAHGAPDVHGGMWGGGEAPHTVSTIYLKVFQGPRGRPSLKRIHPKKKPDCLQVSGLPVSIALRVYQNRPGFQRHRTRTAPELV